jgi:hypothetical protein
VVVVAVTTVAVVVVVVMDLAAVIAAPVGATMGTLAALELKLPQAPALALEALARLTLAAAVVLGSPLSPQ